MARIRKPPYDDLDQMREDMDRLGEALGLPPAVKPQSYFGTGDGPANAGKRVHEKDRRQHAQKNPVKRKAK